MSSDWDNIFNRDIMRNITLVILLTIIASSLAFGQQLADHPMINGMSFIGPQKPGLDEDTFQELLTTNSNWVGLVPEATLDRQTLRLIPDQENKHWGNTMDAQVQAILLAKEAGLEIFIKPHIVLDKRASSKSTSSQDKTKGASWRGDFKAQNETDWNTWEESYETYILKLAQLAETHQVELFSIGTEMREFVIERPEFWSALINKVRAIYSGKITYCANWDEYDKVQFWGQLDYLGIDAYFPVNQSETPSVKKTIKKWKPIKKKLKNLSRLHNKKILLTEYGYRNVSFSGHQPWIHDDGLSERNDRAQVNLYEAFFRTFWNEDWVAGGFSWNWQHQVISDTDFTIQNKPALAIVRRWYRIEHIY